jgi:hypothetical protein
MSRFSILAGIAALLLLAVPGAWAQTYSTAFTYQGQLMEDGVGVNTTRAHFVFQLWDAAFGGHQIGTDYELTDVDIVDGIFTVLLDFGENAFDGSDRYLAIGVDTSGGNQFTWLNPRQPVTPAPTALFSLHGGDNPWVISGTKIHYPDGNVGIGSSDPTYPLDVWTDAQVNRVISGVSEGSSASTIGVYGEVDGAGATAIYGRCLDATGTGRGVMGTVQSPQGVGVYGRNTASTGEAVGVYGQTSSSTGFAGYFVGRGYFSGRLGIGTENPTTDLDVAGGLRTQGFILDLNPQDGYVLTCDATGRGTWQPPAAGTGLWNANGNDIYYDAGNVGIGISTPSSELDVNGQIQAVSLYANTIQGGSFSLFQQTEAGYVLTSDASGNASWQPGSLGLPFEGTTASTTPAFKVVNTETSIGSHGIAAEITGAGGSSDRSAGYFMADGTPGHAIAAFSDAASTIYADHDGPSWALWTTSSGGGGYFSCSGYGDNAVEGRASGEGGHGVYATASGGGAALMAEATGASGYGIVAIGSTLAGKFYGNVAIYEYGTENKVLEFGKGLDYAEGFDVTEADREDLPKGTVLVIDPDNPGHLTRSRRAYDRRVAGIVAGANGLGSGVRLGGENFDHDVALAGRVYCNVVALGEDIQPGDLLTTSDVPGYAMKVTDHARAQGAVLGKAMEPLARGRKGQILVLVTLQ